MRYLQAFSFTAGKKLDGKNELNVNGTDLKLNQDFYPLNFSANGDVHGSIVDVGYGIAAPAIRYNSYKNIGSLKGKIFLIESSTPEGDNPHSQFGPYADLHAKVDSAVRRGAIAVIFTNHTAHADDPGANLDITSVSASIPVLFVKYDVLKPYMDQPLHAAKMDIHLSPIDVTGHNVVALLDNHATQTIVIGAHYDHLGKGEYGNSLYRGAPAIHPGADDNASGTAGVMELAELLKRDSDKKNNYLFINFSGEEEGLVGSKYWTSNPTYDTSKINYMINMDMIGRYRSDKGLEIDGLGTAPSAFTFIRNLQFDSLKIKIGEQGTGPTDFTSFYYIKKPVLNFFTGTHEDYHKPTDVASKINYEGEKEILELIVSIVHQLEPAGKIPFTETAASNEQQDIPQFKVRLGILPDYLFDGPGLRVDGVDDGKPAAQAGILKGDVILSIDDYPTGDIMAYMKALSAYDKGDTATIHVKRGDKDLHLKVTF